MWVESYYKKAHPGIELIERNDRNNEEVVEKITDKIKAIAGTKQKEYQAVAKNAKEVSKIALLGKFDLILQEGLSDRNR